MAQLDSGERPNKKKRKHLFPLSLNFSYFSAIALRSHSPFCGVYRQNIELFCEGFDGFVGFGGCYKILKLIKDVVVKTRHRGGIKIIHILAYSLRYHRL